MASKILTDNSDKFQNYLIACAKNSLKNDISEAKTWLLTAKVLYPDKFGVQFLAYQIAKNTENMSDAAKSFTDLLASFPNEPEFSFEEQALTHALRQYEDHESPLESADFLVKLFYQLPSNVQRCLLLNCASKTVDALDHCKLMLLLFRKFSADVALRGAEVMEDLICTENRSPLITSQNSFRKLLVCDLLPLLAQSNIELSTNNLIRLLDKAVEFYISCAFEPNKRTRRDDREGVFVDDPWTKLWEVLYLLGHKLQWELSQTFTRYWNRETFFKTLLNFSKRTDESSQRQITFCTLIVLLRCVHEYLPIVEPANSDAGYVLVEAFCTAENLPLPTMGIIKKTEDEKNMPMISAGNGAPPQLVTSFSAAIRCLEVLHTADFTRREFMRLRKHWNIDPWLQTFLVDASLYHGGCDKSMVPRADDIKRKGTIAPELIRLSFFYQISDVVHVVDSVSKVATLLANLQQPGVNNANQLTINTLRSRHVHFLLMTRAAILQYCVKILLKMLSGRNNDLAIGHSLVLIQLNWPAENELLDELTEIITRRSCFSYFPMFTQYVINIDILERFAYLAGPNGPKIVLDIFANNQNTQSSRRMSTRGIDKGAREDFKAAMRSQIVRWNEPVDELLVRFLKIEYELIQRSLMI